MNQEALLAWYERNKRPLPWRLEPSPWSILLSEILLQQTQMERGIEYHERLLKRFPTLSSMAESSVDDVLLLGKELDITQEHAASMLYRLKSSK